MNIRFSDSPNIISVLRRILTFIPSANRVNISTMLEFTSLHFHDKASKHNLSRVIYYHPPVVAFSTVSNNLEESSGTHNDSRFRRHKTIALRKKGRK